MLFRSLIDRLLVAHDADDEANAYISASSKLSYIKHPGLLQVMRNILSASLPSSNQKSSLQGGQRSSLATEAYFPVLDLLRRVPPPTHDKEAFLNLVSRTATSAQWHVRTISSRAFASLAVVTHNQEVALGNLLHELPFEPNALHGRLLSAFHVCQFSLMQLKSKPRETTASIADGLQIVDWITTVMYLLGEAYDCITAQPHNMVIIASCLDVMNFVGNEIIRHPHPPMLAAAILARIVAKIKLNIAREKESIQVTPGKSLYQRATLHMFVTEQLLHVERTPTNNPRKYEKDVKELCQYMHEADEQAAIQVIQSINSTLNAAFEVTHRHLHFAEVLLSLMRDYATPDLKNACYDAISDVAAREISGVTHYRFIQELLRDMEPPAPCWQATSPRALEANLRMTGFVLGAKYADDSRAGLQVDGAVQTWTATVHSCLDDNNVSYPSPIICPLN